VASLFSLLPLSYKASYRVTCNGLFGVPAGAGGDPDPNRFFELVAADVVVKRREAWHLLWDFNLLKGCVRELPKTSVLQNKALWVANKIMDTFRINDLSTIAKCRKIAEEVLGKGWSEKGPKLYEEGEVFNKDDYKLWAIGHTHIDSAWLWPYSATQQKVARSWSTQIDLMDRYPEYKFTASTAQQYAWLEELYPELFKKVQKYVADGRFIPIGGTWVENDANLPSGEAFVRQFLYGQRYFKSRFGKRCSVFWLPDTFGYNAQIPQSARNAGMDYFFTQKLGWSNINRFPHNTMMWAGLDGTQIITHMTPVNNYDSMCGVDDIQRGLTNNQDLGVQPTALLLFGRGDGGGGPSEVNIENLRRARAVYNNGYTEMPKVHSGKTPQEFFENVVKSTDNGERLATWNGEIYLEKHRGVYTSHGSIKKWNRKLEIMMSQLEWLSTLASVSGKYVYPKDAIDNLWEPLLLNQFHDVLPGSSIRMVYNDAERIYADISKKGKKLIKEAIAELEGDKSKGDAVVQAVNTLGVQRLELVAVPNELMAKSEHGSFIASKAVQQSQGSALLLLQDKEGTGKACIASAPASIMRNLEAISLKEAAHNCYQVQNGTVQFSVDHGRITSIRVLAFDDTWRELIAAGRTAGLSSCQDYPPDYDAWETEIYSYQTDEEIKFDSVRVAQNGPWRSVLELQANWSQSKITLRVTLDAIPASTMNARSKDARSLIRFDAEVDWQEKHKFLRFEVPTILRSDTASFETQFGITKRPTTRNTTWEAAKFEVCGHKFADLSESMLGLALLTDCKYGYSVEGGLMRISLLKAATYPDAHQDEGYHAFSFAVYPHINTLEGSDVVHVARAFNAPLSLDSRQASVMPIRLDSPKHATVIIDTIKRAEEDFEYHGEAVTKGGKGIVVRLYESLGSHTHVVLSTSLPIKEVKKTNLLEDDDEGNSTSIDFWTMINEDSGEDEKQIALDFKPFEVITIKMRT
jgi:alpha-mannosidase